MQTGEETRLPDKNSDISDTYATGKNDHLKTNRRYSKANRTDPQISINQFRNEFIVRHACVRSKQPDSLASQSLLLLLVMTDRRGA